MNILVTGGAGFIGSHACKRLAQAGYTPIAYDNLFRGHAHAVKWGPLEEGDIRDGARVIEVMRQHEVRAVLHFAALAYVGESFSAAGAYHDINVAGTWSLLEAMRAAGVRKLVYSSTCAVYGAPPEGFCSEDMPSQPISPYGASKAAAEQLLRMHALTNGLRFVSLRYFNAAGADPDGELGEDHDPETHLIPLAIKAALPNGAPLSIFGLDYPTRDGSAERDYVHVSDLAEAHLAALEHLLEGGASGLVNLCTGGGATVLEVCAAVRDVLGAAPRTLIAPRRPGDPPRLTGSGEKTRALLNWRPARSDLRQMITDAAQWIHKPPIHSVPMLSAQTPPASDRPAE
ncbi:MAG TPA: UDP-glucose 4-epimerase GalE [Candidatus Binatia bacterium]|nr:UDP-glucose 4-epimerase GalE [Candidatus Binatia bacterium]